MSKTDRMLAACLAFVSLLSAACARVEPLAGPDGRPDPRSLASMERIGLNGCEQWIFVLGRRAENPVLLWLDGGPGGSELGLVRRHLRPLSEIYTVVSWDQRGAAKSWEAVADKRTLKPADYVADALALSERLAGRFGKRKIYLAGHSWGSVIGLQAALERPGLFEAYVGVAQQVNSAENDRLSYELALAGAREAGRTDAAEVLERNGPPPYSGGEGKYSYLFGRLRGHASGEGESDGAAQSAAFGAPEHSLWDKINLIRGLQAGAELVYPQLAGLDFERDAPELACPVFFVHGRRDRISAASIVERYFMKLRAPRKDLAWFDDSGHAPCFEEPDKFIEYMAGTVLASTAAR